jgi:diguanylate cyclase (GGDEF)-like protein
MRARFAFSIQLAALALLSALALAGGWLGLQAREAEARADQVILEQIRAAVREIIGAPLELASGVAGAQQERYERDLAGAEEALATLRARRPDLAVEIDATAGAMGRLKELSYPALPERGTPAYGEYIKLLKVAQGALYSALDRLNRGLLESDRVRQAGVVWGLLACWLLGLAVYAATWVVARRAQRRESARDAAALGRSHEAIARGLDAVWQEVSAPGPVAHPQTEALSAAAARASQYLADLRDTLRLERQRAAFTNDLVEALDLADSEVEVCATYHRAVRLAFPEMTPQFLLANNSETQLLPQLSESPCACAAPAPQGCPVLRKARTLRHKPDGGLARCPRLLDPEADVTCAAISVRGQAVGVLQLIGRPREVRYAETLAPLGLALGARLGVVRTLDERELQASTDALTGLANRRAMNDALRRLDLTDSGYAVVSADLDHFKRLNDTYGHDTGDRCLKLFAQALRDASRAGDLACRPGGEEFTLLLPDASAQAAAAVAERVRQRLSELSRAAGLGFTASFGVAARAAGGDPAEALLRSADQALYSAKEAGRDRVAIAGAKGAPALVVLGG